MTPLIRPARRLVRRPLRKARFVTETARRRDLLEQHTDHALTWMAQGWLVADTASRLSTAEVMKANLQLVAPLLRADKVPFFMVPSVSENRHRLGVLDRFSDRVLDLLALTYPGQPVYFDLFTETGDRNHVIADDLPDVLRVAGRVLMVRVYRAYAWPNNAFLADTLHAAEIEFWSASERAWTAPFGNRVTNSVPAGETERTTIQIRDEAYPTLKPFADKTHAALLDFPVDLVFPAPPASTVGPDRPRLRRALRSVWMYAQGFRFVVIVVDDNTPAWLNQEHPQLKIVRAADMTDVPGLDTRAAAGTIDGLADSFVLAGDTIVLRRPFRPSDCFHSNGLARIWTDANLLSAPQKSPPDRLGAVAEGEAQLRTATGGLVLNRLLDVPLSMKSSAVRGARDLLGDTTRSVQPLDPYDVQYFAFASGTAVASSLRHHSIDDLSRAAGAGGPPQPTSVSTVGGVESAATHRLLDAWCPAPSPFERARSAATTADTAGSRRSESARSGGPA